MALGASPSVVVMFNATVVFTAGMYRYIVNPFGTQNLVRHTYTSLKEQSEEDGNTFEWDTRYETCTTAIVSTYRV